MIGTTEIAVIGIAVLLLFGANKIPELAKAIGQSYGEFKKAKLRAKTEIEEFGDEFNGLARRS